MSNIEIGITAMVFDDPKFCQQIYTIKPKKCPYLGSKIRQNDCTLFNLTLDYESDSPVKHKNCLLSWQVSKMKKL